MLENCSNLSKAFYETETAIVIKPPVISVNGSRMVKQIVQTNICSVVINTHTVPLRYKICRFGQIIALSLILVNIFNIK